MIYPPIAPLIRHADYVAEQLEKPPLIMIDLEGDTVEKIRQQLQTPGAHSRVVAAATVTKLSRLKP